MIEINIGWAEDRDLLCQGASRVGLNDLQQGGVVGLDRSRQQAVSRYSFNLQIQAGSLGWWPL